LFLCFYSAKEAQKYKINLQLQMQVENIFPLVFKF